MNFGTLQSITKEPQKAQQMDLDDNTELDAPAFDELDDNFGGEAGDDLGGDFDDDFDDELGDDDKLSSVGYKLLALRDEIEQILADMGLSGDDEFGSEFGDESVAGLDDQFDDELGDEPADGLDDQFDDKLGDEPEDGLDDQFGDELGDDVKKNSFSDEPELTEPEDEDFQGDIRTVKGANLVYKRKTETGNYEELWIYKVGDDVQKEVVIRRAILAGTDIVPSQRESEDGTQEAETTTLGNVQYLKISGLPN